MHCQRRICVSRVQTLIIIPHLTQTLIWRKSFQTPVCCVTSIPSHSRKTLAKLIHLLPLSLSTLTNNAPHIATHVSYGSEWSATCKKQISLQSFSFSRASLLLLVLSQKSGRTYPNSTQTRSHLCLPSVLGVVGLLTLYSPARIDVYPTRFSGSHSAT